ncbi:MAG: hypothetical protein FD149_161 [Rhodospirillaceae bacterium]|nr:MAG: hypothetical protein FD149_161 [Rhodospirillaceae bacterium]
MNESPRLLLFATTKLSDMLAKGNVWYIRHYENYFATVDVAYLLGGPMPSQAQGSTTLHSLGRGYTPFDLILAPLRLWIIAKRIHQ